MNSLYASLIQTRIDAALSTARQLDELDHAGERGYVRERLIADLFRPLLPPAIGVGTGVIIDEDGAQSTQVDIVLYNRATVPSVMLNGDHGVFPIESVIYVIEAKSTLTANAYKQAEAAAQRLSQQKSRSDVRPTCAVFALSSDTLNSSSEAVRYEQHCIRDVPKLPHLRAICVADKGYWYFSGTTFDWRKWPGDPTIGFISTLLNMLPEHLAQQTMAKMGCYITDF